MQPWLKLNNEVISGNQIDARKDIDALQVYFQEEVNPNTVFFHNLAEKVRYMVEHGYWEPALFERFSPEEVQAVFDRAYSFKFRFKSFMGAYKFYNEYATKTPDRSRWLERYEDRMAITALARSSDVEQALELVGHLVQQHFTPATPTLMNSGKANTGRLVSCFKGDALVDTANGRVRIDQIQVGDEVLTHDGTYRPVTEVMKRREREGFFSIGAVGIPELLVTTPEHPVLVLRAPRAPQVPSPHHGDGAEGGLQWIEARHVMPGDQIALAVDRSEGQLQEIEILDFLNAAESRAWSREAKVIDGKLVLTNNNPKHVKRNGTEASQQATAINPAIRLDHTAGRLFGYYLSEGYVHRYDGAVKGVRFTVGTQEQWLIDDVVRVCEEVFGFKPKISSNPNDNSTVIAVWSGLIGEFFLNTVGTGFGTKRLPEWMMRAPSEFIQGLIVGAFRGDGCTTTDGCVLTFSNPELIAQIQRLMLRAGVIATRRNHPTASGTVAGTLKIMDNKPVNRALIAMIDKNMDKLRELADEGVDNWLAKSDDNTRHFRWVETSYGQVPLAVVKLVSFDEEQADVYNLEVDRNHTYSVNGFVVHNCFLLQDCTDNLSSITKTMAFVAELSKGGGGIGVSLDNLRAKGESLRNIQNVTKGVVGVAKMLDNVLRYADQAGQRLGAGAIYLSVMHADFMDLLASKKIATDEDSRLKTLSVGAVIPDIFMEKHRDGEDIYQFYPHSVKKATGMDFTDIDWERDYQALADNPDIRKKRVSARKVMEEIAITQGESGYPYLLFQGTANRANPIPNVGTIHMSNLCSEILQPTVPSTYHPYGQEAKDVIGLDVSCNLASLVIGQSMASGELGRVVGAAVAMLDDVARSTSVDEVPAVRRANETMRSIGLGAMGLHSFLATNEIEYGSEEALDFVNVFFAAMHYHARRKSMQIARDTGFVFDGFAGSRYASGEHFAQYLAEDFLPKTARVAELFAGHTLPTRADWAELIGDIAEHGLAHSFVMAVAPTGSISYVSYASQSIMPITDKVEVRTSSKARTIYPMPGLNATTEWFYTEAYDMDMRAVIDTVAAAQRHVDQGISCTLFVPSTVTTRELQKYYIYAYRKGVKTLYYTRLRKSTIEECLSCAI